MMLSTALRSSAVFLVLAQALAGKCQAQQVSYERATPQQLAGIAKDNSRHFGDDPDDGGPIATDLSASLDPAAVGKAMRKVGDWQLARSQEYFDRIWTWSVLYSGFMAGFDSLGEVEDHAAIGALQKKDDLA